MLIASPRHRTDDLKLWRPLEAADAVYGRWLLKPEKVTKSLEAIRSFVSAGTAYCGVSWGKDSVVAAHLCREVAPEVPLVNLRCSNRNPDCDAVRDVYFSAFPGQAYSEVEIDYGDLHAGNLARHELDAGTDELWYAGIAKCNERFGQRRILGVRADESGRRRIRCLRWGQSSKNGCAPLAWWTLADVFGYLAVNRLPVHPAYAMLGNGRWPRERLRTAEIGDTHGTGSGRGEWEREYYGDMVRRLVAG